MDKMKKNLDSYLVTGLLVAAAFVIGMLFTEVRYLKKGVPTAGVAGTNVPTDTAPLGGDVVNLDNLAPVDDTDHLRGNPDAEITLIEYSDYECPFCKGFHDTMVQVLEEYDGKVNWVFRHYPLSFHQYAEPVAQAAECVNKLGGNDAFWAFTDAYFARTEATGTGFPQEDVPALAAEVAGVNASAVETCIASGEFKQNVADEMAGGAQAGVSGTPGTILVTKSGEAELISGALPYAQIQQIIDKYLE